MVVAGHVARWPRSDAPSENVDVLWLNLLQQPLVNLLRVMLDLLRAGLKLVIDPVARVLRDQNVHFDVGLDVLQQAERIPNVLCA